MKKDLRLSSVSLRMETQIDTARLAFPSCCWLIRRHKTQYLQLSLQIQRTRTHDTCHIATNTPVSDVTMRATANASSKQLPLVTRHAPCACGFIRRMIRTFVCNQCNMLSFSVLLQYCIKCSLYVASNEMLVCEY
jgi:hypothetical protein